MTDLQIVTTQDVTADIDERWPRMRARLIQTVTPLANDVIVQTLFELMRGERRRDFITNVARLHNLEPSVASVVYDVLETKSRGVDRDRVDPVG